MPKAIDEALEQAERERERRLSELDLDDNGSLGLQSIYRSPRYAVIGADACCNRSFAL